MRELTFKEMEEVNGGGWQTVVAIIIVCASLGGSSKKDKKDKKDKKGKGCEKQNECPGYSGDTHHYLRSMETVSYSV